MIISLGARVLDVNYVIVKTPKIWCTESKTHTSVSYTVRIPKAFHNNPKNQNKSFLMVL